MDANVLLTLGIDGKWYVVLRDVSKYPMSPYRFHGMFPFGLPDLEVWCIASSSSFLKRLGIKSSSEVDTIFLAFVIWRFLESSFFCVYRAFGW